MSDPFDNRTLPRGLLIAVASLIGFTLLAVTSYTLTHRTATVDTTSAASASRDLRFVDVGAGEVAIYAWPEGRRVATLQPGSENFIRGVLRGMARERRSIGAGDAAPFRITRFADGRVTLEDRATGRVLFLNAFGVTNAAAFENLIDADESVSLTPALGSAG
jgi:putative photosynthetic complex assembly protein